MVQIPGRTLTGVSRGTLSNQDHQFKRTFEKGGMLYSNQAGRTLLSGVAYQIGWPRQHHLGDWQAALRPRTGLRASSSSLQWEASKIQRLEQRPRRMYRRVPYAP